MNFKAIQLQEFPILYLISMLQLTSRVNCDKQVSALILY